MKTKETTGYLGDGGGGDGHSGSGPYRGPAARAQPGTSEKDWAAMTKGQRKVWRRKQNKVKNRNAEPETRTHPDT